VQLPQLLSTVIGSASKLKPKKTVKGDYNKGVRTNDLGRSISEPKKRASLTLTLLLTGPKLSRFEDLGAADRTRKYCYDWFCYLYLLRCNAISSGCDYLDLRFP